MYPALAVLQALEGNLDEILWVGSQGGMEAELVQRLKIPFQAIPAAGLHGIGIRTLPANLVKLARGVAAAGRILKDFRPHAVLYTGGFIAAPMALVARQIPSLLFVPDIEPGMALKFIARFASIIALTSMESAKYFKHHERLIETGYPTRSNLLPIDKTIAKTHFGLKTEKPTILAFGGSKGAHSINQALTAILPDLLEIAQVIHISGAFDWHATQTIFQQLPVRQQADYKIFPYLHEEMGLAFSASDLVISRAGASTLGEYPLFKLPAILIPYPHAWRYQKVNAQFLASQGAAMVINDEDLAAKLFPALIELFDNPHEITKMGSSMAQLLQPQAASKIADLLLEIAGKTQTERGTA